MRKLLLLVVAALVVAVAGSASLVSRTGDAQESAGTPTPCPSPMASPEAEAMASPAAVEPSPLASPVTADCMIVVEGNDAFAFVPNEIRIPADTEVLIVFVNVGAIQHDFTVNDLNLHVVAQPGEQSTRTFTASAGTYEFYCSVPGHAASGMVGTLVVE